MIYYLYNPLSKGGKGEFVSRKQAKKHERKGEKTECFSLLDIREDISVFLKRLSRRHSGHLWRRWNSSSNNKFC